MMEEIKYVSQGELEAILIRVRSAKAVGIVALTLPSCFYARIGGSRKADAELCPPVLKKQHVVGMTCFEYERARNNDNARDWARQVDALKAEGKAEEASILEAKGPEKHELKSRNDSRERIEGTPLVRNAEGNIYVQMMIPTGNHPQWPSGRRETSYCFDPAHSNLLLEHWAKYGPKAMMEAYGEESLNSKPAVEYSLEEGEKNSLYQWLKPYSRSKADPVDFDYREYRTDHILEVRHEGVRYVVRREARIEAA